MKILAIFLTGPFAADPYLNTDAGTMSPFEHGEVFVLDDGGEVFLYYIFLLPYSSYGIMVIYGFGVKCLDLFGNRLI